MSGAANQFQLRMGLTHPTTTIIGIIRFLQSTDFPNNGILAPDRKVFLSDALAGLEILIENAQDGESWTWQYFTPSGLSAGTSTLMFLANFLGQTNCFTFGIFGPTACGSNSTLAISAPSVHCGALGTWTVNLSHNGALLTTDHFDLVSTGAKAEVILSPDIINPQVLEPHVSVAPGTTAVTVSVTDSGCPNLPIANASVTVSAETLPNSGGHTHNIPLAFQNGTGKFSSTAHSVSVPSDQKTATGITDRNGALGAINYTAGNISVDENIKATTTVSGVTAEGKAKLTIAITGLLPLGLSPDRRLTGQTSSHPDNHFATPNVLDRISDLAALYKGPLLGSTRGTLGINDMSLPFGGLFDICGTFDPKDACANATRGGHFFHRIGIDVDIDSTDSAGVAVNRDILTYSIVCKLGGRPVREAKIHYRFDNQPCTF